jgi:hypothetical protein
VVRCDVRVSSWIGYTADLKGRNKKAIPLQALTGPEGSRRLRQSAHEGGKVVGPTQQEPLPTGSNPGTHFC